MFKFMNRLKEGHLIGLGFEEGNFQKLKEGKPIRILYSELKLPWPGGIVVLYPDAEFEANKHLLDPKWSVIKLNDVAMNVLRSGQPVPFKFTAAQVPGSSGGEVMMFWGKDADAIRETFEPMIGPNSEDLSPAIPAGQHRHKS